MKGTKGITLIALIITIIVLLILAVAAISAVQNSDIITYAKKAASATEMAQIKEEAQLANTEMFLEAKMDSSKEISKKNYIAKLQDETFAGRVTERVADVLIIDGIYALSVIDPDFNVEVREYDGVIDADQLLTLSYTTSDDVVIEDKKQQITITLNLKAIMSDTDYQSMKESQETSPIFGEMEQDVFDYWETMLKESGLFETGQEPTINSIDDYTTAFLNVVPDMDEVFVDKEGNRIKHDTLQEWLAEPTLLAVINGANETELTQEQLTADIVNSTMHGYSDYEEHIEEIYNSEIKESTDYTSEYNVNTTNLSLYINNNETPEKTSINATTAGTDILEHVVTENGTYEFIVKNESGDIVAFEKIIINSIVQSSDYVPAGGEWETDGNGTITKYTGTATKVTIPKYVGDEAITQIKGIQLTPINVNFEKVIIPDTITSINQYSFYNCKNLKEIIVPNSVTTIQRDAFEGCTSLTNIDLPDQLTVIESEVFKGCINLKSMDIPNSVTNIGESAFEGCTSLASISLPNSLTNITRKAFYNCSGLIDIFIPDSVTNIGINAFDGCTSLTSVRLSNSITTIDIYTFSGCKNLTSIIIPDSVKSLQESCFLNCTNLSNVTLSNSLEKIGRKSFDNCTSLTSIIIPNTVTFIGKNAFRDTKLTTITIPDSVTDIESDAFDTTTLTTIYYNDTILKTGFPWGADNAVKGQ